MKEFEFEQQSIRSTSTCRSSGTSISWVYVPSHGRFKPLTTRSNLSITRVLLPLSNLWRLRFTSRSKGTFRLFLHAAVTSARSAEARLSSPADTERVNCGGLKDLLRELCVFVCVWQVCLIPASTSSLWNISSPCRCCTTTSAWYARTHTHTQPTHSQRQAHADTQRSVED